MIADFRDDDSERKRDAKRKRENRSKDRDIKIGRCKNPKRREAALSDVYAFLDLYFCHRFYNPLTQMHRDMVQAILYRATHGGNQAIAAPRGEGKTTIAECMITYCILRGLLKFPLIVAATGADATRILDNIKHEFEANELLAADFPEVCDPIIALEGGTARQNMQTVGGERTRLKWSTDLIVFPTVPKKYKSPCGGTVLMTRGMDAAIRGLKHFGQRPDFTLGDDLETRESSASEAQVETRKQILFRDVAGLAGQGKKMATVVTGTNQNRYCLMYHLTDPVACPSYAGRRYKLLEQFPTNAELWDRYMELRQSGMAGGDPDAIEATKFYLENREAMDAGAVVSNPNRYIPETEHSALQHCYNIIADRGMDAFLTECQNDPKDESTATLNEISSALVGTRISDYTHQEFPAGCEKLVSFADLGHTFFNCVDSAWKSPCIGFVSDHYPISVSGVTHKSDEDTLERAFLRHLHQWRDRLMKGYRDCDDQGKVPDLCLIDSGSGLHTRAVYQFCREVGAPFYPSKGFSETWKVPKIARRKGDHWALVEVQTDGRRSLIYEFDSTYWKLFAQQRFLTPTKDEGGNFRDGSLSLFRLPPNAKQIASDRRDFTHHVCNEIWGSKKLGAKPAWIMRGPNHYLDAIAGNCLAASICGINLIGEATRSGRLPSNQRPSPADLIAKAKA